MARPIMLRRSCNSPPPPRTGRPGNRYVRGGRGRCRPRGFAPSRPRPAVVSCRAMLSTAPDSAYVELVAPTGQHPLLLLCDHAGRQVPEAMARLGISEEMLA